MAIETVYLFNNTSVVHDEILGQRIGLVPLAVDPHMFTMPGNMRFLQARAMPMLRDVALFRSGRRP
jgi:DNA-directed RNA polymerase alpha subunit